MNWLVFFIGNFIIFGRMFLVVEGIEVELIFIFMVKCMLFKMMLIVFIIFFIDKYFGVNDVIII